MSWETTIRTGSFEGDRAALAQCDAQARAQGLVLRTTPLPGGGVHVVAAPPGPPPPAYGPAYGQPPGGAPPGYGAPGGAPVGALARPVPYGMPQGGAAPVANPQAAFGAGGPSHASHASRDALGGGVGGAICQVCGVQGPVKRATFMQNIGLIVVRLPRTLQGEMCRRCIDATCWRYTLVTLFLGWWGVISFFYSLASIPTNIINWMGAWKLPEPPRHAYDRAGVAYVSWPGWRIAILALGILGALSALLGTLAVVAAIVDQAQNGSLDGGSVGTSAVAMLFAWALAALMLVGALKRPAVAVA
jgi:hypothetical protein